MPTSHRVTPHCLRCLIGGDTERGLRCVPGKDCLARRLPIGGCRSIGGFKNPIRQTPKARSSPPRSRFSIDIFNHQNIELLCFNLKAPHKFWEITSKVPALFSITDQLFYYYRFFPTTRSVFLVLQICKFPKQIDDNLSQSTLHFQNFLKARPIYFQFMFFY